MALSLPRIAGRLYNTPLMLAPDVAVTIASALAERFGVEPIAEGVVEASSFRGKPGGMREGERRAPYRVENGVAIVAVHGELVNRGAWIGASSGLTSYEGMGEALRRAEADATIRGIILDVDSPGGEATGAMEAGAHVRQVASRKPIVAFVNGMAASAGYAVACGAGAIVTTPTSELGSIGVVVLHLDRSAQLDRAGVKPTLLHAGAHKIDGTSTRPLADGPRARMQAHVDALYGLFVAHVAELRGMDAEAVRATEAGLFRGKKAVDQDLAEMVGTFDDAVALLPAYRSGGALPPPPPPQQARAAVTYQPVGVPLHRTGAAYARFQARRASGHRFAD